MSTLSSILTRYNFKPFRPGENESSFTFSGAGICILTLETEKDGERLYRPLLACEATNDALTVAKSLLTQSRAERELGYLFVYIAPVSEIKAERLAVLKELSAHCKTGSD